MDGNKEIAVYTKRVNKSSAQYHAFIRKLSADV